MALHDFLVRERVDFFIGPVVGALAGEFIAGKNLVDAGGAGGASLIGNLAGLVSKLLIVLLMIALFLTSLPSPFKPAALA